MMLSGLWLLFSSGRGYELGIGDLSKDVAGGALDGMEDDFGMATEDVVDLLPLTDVINGSPS